MDHSLSVRSDGRCDPSERGAGGGLIFTRTFRQFCAICAAFSALALMLLVLCDRAFGLDAPPAEPSLSPYPSAHAQPGLAEVPAVVREEFLRGSDQAGAFSAGISEMAVDLFGSLEEPDPQSGDLADGLVVTTFVDLRKLSRTSSFGRYVAEQLMTECQRAGYPVMEMRLSKSVLIQERRGEYGLSREPSEIADRVAARAMLTGTYLVAEDHVLVNARIVDSATSRLLSSATARFPRTALAEKLLADAASSRPRKNEVVYMKKLEM